MLFGNEKDESFQGSLAAIYQTFGAKQGGTQFHRPKANQ
jgi:hypothetical protein